MIQFNSAACALALMGCHRSTVPDKVIHRVLSDLLDGSLETVASANAGKMFDDEEAEVPEDLVACFVPAWRGDE